MRHSLEKGPVPTVSRWTRLKVFVSQGRRPMARKIVQIKFMQIGFGNPNGLPLPYHMDFA